MALAVKARDVPGRMVLVPRAVVAGRRAVVLTVVVAVVIVRAGRARLSVRGQQHVVAVRVVGAQGRVQAGRVAGAARQHRRNGLRCKDDDGLRSGF